MRTIMLAMAAASLAVPAALVVPASTAEASAPKKNAKYREWRGKDGRRYCRKSDGTTGLVVGAVGGALLGTAVDSGVGTAIGAVGGALLGQSVEKKRARAKCR
jgi:uncharacterized protein YcfJ